MFGKSKQINKLWLYNYVEYKNYFIVSQKTWVMYYLSSLFKNYGLEFHEFIELHFCHCKIKIIRAGIY